MIQQLRRLGFQHFTFTIFLALPGAALAGFAAIGEGELTNLIGPIVKGLLNKLLGKGIPISPGKGALLSNGTVFTEDGFITLAADFSQL